MRPLQGVHQFLDGIGRESDKPLTRIAHLRLPAQVVQLQDQFGTLVRQAHEQSSRKAKGQGIIARLNLNEAVEP